MDLKQESAKIQLRFLERVIGQAFQEGATVEAIDAYLATQGVTDPDIWRARVEARKITPLLGAIELRHLGGRDQFRTIFGLTPAPVVVAPSVQSDYPHTEMGDAECFAHLNADDLRFDHRQGRWLISDETTGLWIPDAMERVIALARDASRYRQAKALTIDDIHERKTALLWAAKGESRSRLSNTLALAQALPPLADDGEHWDDDPWLLGCLNGVVDLRTGLLRRATPEERITLRCRVEYDPAATCPLWLSTLQGVFAHEDQEESQRVIDFVQRALGYSITGDCSEECCFFAWGDGANGKGTIMNTVGWLLHYYTDDMPYSTLERSIHGGGIPNDVAKIAGKRFITCAEINEFTLNESRLKALTGRDPMTARFLNQEFFTFIPVGKIWIATNNKPRVTGQDDGIWRRIHLIPFTNTFVGPNKNGKLKDQLKERELPGILTWLVRGAMLWMERGLDPPDTVKVATESYRQESDPLTQFLEACCVIQEGVKAQAAGIWSEYQRYTTGHDDLMRLTDKAFHKAMSRRFRKDIERVGVNRSPQSFYYGVGLMVDRPEPGKVDF